ncbi:MAG: trypsin-like peptidase domain-containing protein [Dokdonella sp.]
MRNRDPYNTLAFIARFAVVGLAAAFVLSVLAPGLVDRLRGTSAGSHAAFSHVEGGPATSSRGPVSYAEAVSRASPAVVNIYANKVTTVQRMYRIPDPLTQRLLGVVPGPLMRRQEQSLGSGVIFSSDGYVLTNNHVINGADDIQVLLDDGRVSTAQIIGSDSETDLAVLKIEATNLPEISVPDDATADVGDVVLAIGNPVGLGKTVTMGIVSATGRQLKMSAYEDFIQTDAAINAGNSGGALVNALGELIGINTAIYPRTPTSNGFGAVTQGAEGIGFAIPVTTAKTVLDQIIRHGRVIRGWIGADYTDIPPATGATARQQGVMVVRVVQESPAAQANVQVGDLLLKLDGVAITDQIDLRNREAALAPGTKVRLEGLRGNLPFALDVVLVQRPAPSTTGA